LTSSRSFGGAWSQSASTSAAKTKLQSALDQQFLNSGAGKDKPEKKGKKKNKKKAE
jgi:hypothetical protein